MALGFQRNAFQNNAFQSQGVVPPPSPGGGGYGASGGGKRNLPKLDDLDTFQKVARRKPGQSIVEALREPDPVKSTVVAKAQPVAVPKPAPAKTQDSLAAVDPLLQKSIDALGKAAEAFTARPAAARPAMKPKPILDTEDDDAEILSIIIGLM